ncbi:LytR/AlgR family response regulator transcription factor [Lutimonas zeaxanthinifaciens]|uniref:LytR/AlgR family response regulator transcription factor n=1 Tax=Lutimonas zeaxanthinifaciens TaxID=3060215 RepID=UPI00265D2947|nr:LytTR family DNA-binding domain-containing protein [Lutimonas sp. YSD2104]WKK66966.1 LytTR family DNA-binding domain-containing protein [Lutimonas sp. YSD2104]
MKIKCIIIDDEPLAAEVVETHLKEFSNIELIGSFTNPLDALQLIENGEVDAVFIDINMPKMNGLDFIKTLDTRPHFIITTAYREYAVESFDLDVLDYLVKPIPFTRFLKSINKLSQKFITEQSAESTPSNAEKSFIFLKVDKKLIKIKFEDIYFIESLKDYIKVFTKTGDYLAHKSLSGITEELPKSQFLRLHRSFTVALDKIQALEGNSVLVADKRIPIGRKYINHAKDVILNTPT